ncbi:LysM peptidoglycan-binding domain-containing protein [Spirochaeta thermophila]|uniref:LysM domain-containing protein n=1 Tax=Winmispira thermophila (strain ATCC 49972 / DSM 6192 / RI 19.B1) TaxID=665571 RepID=E0RND1_WINT6|nr:LysM peptidoglycan-binding domain-containing protein [Spirochaeta thermophila]ADN01131.1 hypothetical protein STHERM_c01550 [Spirochaeta thermophila DSM 6192]
MARPRIAIRLADNSLFPVLEEGTPSRKRVVLEPAHTHQRAVHIDLYRTLDEEGGEYLGTLTVDLPDYNGEKPEVELVLEMDEHEHLSATARERTSGETRHLELTMEEPSPDTDFSMLTRMHEEGEYEEEASLPERSYDEDFGTPFDEEASLSYEEGEEEEGFSFEEERRASSSLMSEEEQNLLQSGFEREEEERSAALPVERRPSMWVPFILGFILGVLVGGVLSYLFLPRVLGEVPAPQVSTAPRPTPAVTSTPAPTQAPEAARPAPSEFTIIYTPTWGDTLWDLADSFYNNPWLYPIIAEENRIANPDLIYAGRPLRIPHIRPQE